VLPRGVVVRFTRFISVLVRKLFDVRLHWARTYDVSVEDVGWREAFIQSGSSMFTLGFEPPIGFWAATLGFAEAAIGLGVLALLIAYLPTIYGAFSRREVLVGHMSVRAGTPPSAVDLLRRAHLINKLDNLDDLWVEWQLWFAELEETHTSLPFVNFFRSPDANRSWITASGAVLDAAAMVNSTIDQERQPQASLCIRSGFTALRSISRFFRIPHPDDPAPDDPISVSRDEWEQACRELEAVGVRQARRDQTRDWPAGGSLRHPARDRGPAGRAVRRGPRTGLRPGHGDAAESGGGRYGPARRRARAPVTGRASRAWRSTIRPGSGHGVDCTVGRRRRARAARRTCGGSCELAEPIDEPAWAKERVVIGAWITKGGASARG
jgi:hypothetical protein